MLFFLHNLIQNSLPDKQAITDSSRQTKQPDHVIIVNLNQPTTSVLKVNGNFLKGKSSSTIDDNRPKRKTPLTIEDNSPERKSSPTIDNSKNSIPFHRLLLILV